jgi:hypothetical protein
MGSGTDECATYDGRFDYDDGVYVGLYDRWSDCGGVGASAVIVAAEPADGSFLTVVIAKFGIMPGDGDALDDVVIATFIVDNADFPS